MTLFSQMKSQILLGPVRLIHLNFLQNVPPDQVTAEEAGGLVKARDFVFGAKHVRRHGK